MYGIVLHCFIDSYSAVHISDRSVCAPRARTPRVQKFSEKGSRHPTRMVTRREERRAYHGEGPAETRDLVWTIMVLICGRTRTSHVKAVYLYWICD